MSASTKPAPERFAALAIRRGIALGALQSASVRDFNLVLAAAATAFPPERSYTEREVNERLRGFLGGAGAMLATDHVELRRWLVDFRVLERDGYGRVYARAVPADDIAELARELAGIDLGALARDARAADAAHRAERKAWWRAGGQASRG
jgi:hypothetical protein